MSKSIDLSSKLEDSSSCKSSNSSLDINGNPISNADSDSTHHLIHNSSTLPWKTKFFYSFGHVYNDMTVSIWFSYTLLFFESRLNHLAGTLLLLGQIADAIASPFFGFASDRFAHWWLFRKYGRRKTWHLFGVVMSTITVPLVYNRCLLGDDQPEWVQFIYYGILVLVFQGGWAATQVTHVALVNDLTPHQSERIALNSYRQAATMASNVVMFMITFFLLQSTNSDSDTKNAMAIQESDKVAFTYLSYIVCAIGIVFTLFFYVFVEEPSVQQSERHKLQHQKSVELGKGYHMDTLDQRKQSCNLLLMRNLKDELISLNGLSPRLSFRMDPNAPSEQKNSSTKKSREVIKSDQHQIESQPTSKPQKRWYHWFCSLSFWKMTTIYTMARMFINVTQVYMPIYLQHYLLLPKSTVAIIPLTTYVASFVFSFITNALSKRFGSRLSLIIGAVIGVASSVWIFCGHDQESYRWYQIYVVAAITGIAGTSLLISSLSLNSDLVGDNMATNAFVFAAMSFFDKSINGIVIESLEQFKPSSPVATVRTAAVQYYQYVMVALTGVPSLCILALVFTIIHTKYGRRCSNATAGPAMGH